MFVVFLQLFPVGSPGIQVELALFGRVVVAALTQATGVVELDVLTSGALAHHGSRLAHRYPSFLSVFVCMWVSLLVGLCVRRLVCMCAPDRS